jgi:HD-like signal output (HDOD) protein
VIEKVLKSAQLISLPDIYIKLKKLMEEPDYTMAEVAVLAGRDPGMAARFLRVVNSPLNRRARNIESVSHAVSLLGINQIHDIVLTASVAEAFEGIETGVVDMKKFWQRSIYCAVMSKLLARDFDTIESDRLFMSGLLHDIGHLSMYLAIPEESRRAILKAEESEKPLYQVEREMLGFDYAKVGGYMMRNWDLPTSLETITWFHPKPGEADLFTLETALLHLGSLLVVSDLENGVFGEGSFTVDHTVWSTTGLTEEQCLGFRQTAADEFDKIADGVYF